MKTNLKWKIRIQNCDFLFRIVLIHYSLILNSLQGFYINNSCVVFKFLKSNNFLRPSLLKCAQQSVGCRVTSSQLYLTSLWTIHWYKCEIFQISVDFEYGLGNIPWTVSSVIQRHHDDGGPRSTWDTPQMQTSLQTMEREDLTGHLGQRKREDDLKGENSKKLGSREIPIRRRNLSCQDARWWLFCLFNFTKAQSYRRKRHESENIYSTKLWPL